MSEEIFYQRQTTLKEVGAEGQKKLKEAKVLVVGAGGLGCPALMYLAAAGVGKITIADHDIISLSNLHRQVLYNPEQVGKYKAEIAKEIISKQNPWITVDAIVNKINLDNIHILTDYELVLDCTDNFASKFLLHDYCYQNHINLLQASIYKFEGQVQFFNYSQLNTKMPCLRCLWQQTPTNQCTGNCQEVGVLGSTAGVLGTIQANEAIKQFLGLPCLETGKTLMVDLLNFSTNVIQWQKDPMCPLCSKQTLQINSTTYKPLDPFEIRFDNQITKKCQFIDIRENDEVNQKKINLPYNIPIINMPLSDFDNSAKTLLDKDENILLICSSGTRSLRLAKHLRDQGFKHCYSLHEGIDTIT